MVDQELLACTASCAELSAAVQRLQAELMSSPESKADSQAEACGEREALMQLAEAQAGALLSLGERAEKLANELRLLQTPSAVVVTRQAALSPQQALEDELETLLAERATLEAAARAEEPRATVALATLRESNSVEERSQREQAALKEKLGTLERATAERAATLRQLAAENELAAAALKALEAHTLESGQTARKSARVRVAALAKLASVEKQRADAEQQRSELALELETLEDAEGEAWRAADAEARHALDLRRELDAICTSQARTLTAAQRQADALQLAETSKRMMQAETAGLRNHAAVLTHRIELLQADLGACAAQAARAEEARQNAVEKGRDGERAIVDLQQQLSDGQEKLAKLERRYEAVRSDRNNPGQAAVEAHAAVQDGTRALDALMQQSSCVKDNIAAVDELVLGQFLQATGLQREHAAAREELKRSHARVLEVQAAVQGQQAESTRLQAAVCEAEAELRRQHSACVSLVQECNRLSVLLGARTAEIRECYEFLKTHHSALLTSERREGEAQRDGQLCSLRLAEALRECDTARRQFAALDALKRELHVLGRQLLAERARRSALAGVPTLNIHRYRFRAEVGAGWLDLQDCNQRLHGELMAKTAALASRTEQLRQEEVLRRNLDIRLARREVTCDAVSRLNSCRADLRSKAQELQDLSADLCALRAAYKEQVQQCRR